MEIPKEWTFKDGQVADGFDAHVNQQLPWYRLATETVAHLARHYIPEKGLVYDIGASNGNIGRAIGGILETRSAKLVAIEESEEMVQKYNAPGKVVCRRAQDYRYREFDLAILFLVLMFVPVADRSNLIHKLRQSLKPGGAIIVFDKVVAPPGYFGTVMRRLTMTWKLNNGATPKEIVDKELSLSGVQRPISPTILGHDAVQFFTFGEFAGWVIEKPE
jgi:tRNA (cmo5U34)-methyltransferase